MLRVIKSRAFQGKKDPNKTYYVCDLASDNGDIAVDVFVDRLLPEGSYVTVAERITNHKLGCTVVPVSEKK